MDLGISVFSLPGLDDLLHSALPGWFDCNEIAAIRQSADVNSLRAKLLSPVKDDRNVHDLSPGSIEESDHASCASVLTHVQSDVNEARRRIRRQLKCLRSWRNWTCFSYRACACRLEDADAAIVARGIDETILRQTRAELQLRRDGSTQLLRMMRWVAYVNDRKPYVPERTMERCDEHIRAALLSATSTQVS